MMMELPVCIKAEMLVPSRRATIGCGRALAKERKVTMPLEMKEACEKCGRRLSPADEAYICVYECTFCAACAEAITAICPNCGGELVRRPRRGKVGSASL